MNPSKTEAIDSVCGMIVNGSTALHAERDGIIPVAVSQAG